MSARPKWNWPFRASCWAFTAGCWAGVHGGLLGWLVVALAAFCVIAFWVEWAVTQ